MARHLVLGHQRRGRHLSHHEAGVQAGVGCEERRQPGERGVGQLLDPPLADGGELGERDGEEVGRKRHGLTVEVAAGEDRSTVVAVGENKWIVGHRVHLDRDLGLDIVEHVAHRAVHLGRAADAVRVLHPHVARAMGFPDRGAAHQRPQVRGGGALPRMLAQRMQPRIERCVGAAQRIGRERRGEIRDAHQAARIQTRQGEQRGHRLGAVDQRETFLRSKLQRDQPGAAQPLRCGRDPAVDPDLPSAEQRQHKMGKRREVPARTDRSAARHDRQDIGFEEGKQRLDDLRPHAGMPACERVRAQQQHPAHRVVVERLSEPRGMTEDHPPLELDDPIRCDTNACEVSESGIDAVHGFAGIEDAAHRDLPRFHRRSRMFREHARPAPPGYLVEPLQPERHPVDGDRVGHRVRILEAPTPSPSSRSRRDRRAPGGPVHASPVAAKACPPRHAAHHSSRGDPK